MLAIKGLAEVRAHRAVVDAGISVALGGHVAAAHSSNQRVGHVILAADDRVELAATLAEIRRTLVVLTQLA